MTAATVLCDTCGESVGESVALWHMATPLCAPCFHIANGSPVCGDCSPDMGSFFDEWPAAVESGAELIPCAVCGQVGHP